MFGVGLKVKLVGVVVGAGFLVLFFCFGCCGFGVLGAGVGFVVLVCGVGILVGLVLMCCLVCEWNVL